LIRVENISKSYGNTIALKNASFTLEKGQIVGLLGVNGAGKSTLLKIMAGINEPDTGNIQILGYDMKDNSLEIKKRIGYLSEDNPLYEDMYVKESICFVADLFNTEKGQVDIIIEKVGLKEEYKKKIKSLSKGNRQRVGIAQALVHNPDFIVLDEPTAGLDPNQRESLNNMLIELGKEKTILLSTHILSDIKGICSRIILIDKGSVMLDEKIDRIGSVEKMFHRLTQ